MAKTLVLGATGRLAGLTAKHLIKAITPSSLRVATSRQAGLAQLKARFPDAEVALADWNDEPSLLAAMEGVNKVLMVAPDFVTDETIATANIIRAARTAGTVELLVRFLGMPPGLTKQDLKPEFLETRCGANLHAIAKHLLDASELPLCYVNVPGWIMFNMAAFFAPEVRANRRIVMPAITDAKRMWVSEHDIAAVMAKILTEVAANHTGQEYVLTSAERYTYGDVARLLTDVLGKPIASVDSDTALRAAMGGEFERLMTYFRHETHAYTNVGHTQTLLQLLGRPPQTLRGYIEATRSKYQ